MNAEELTMFQKADERIHKVEDEYCYPIFTKHGFIPVDLTGVGFVRSYRFKKGTHLIRYSIGVNADYWIDLNVDAGGYWDQLDRHLAAKN